MGVEKVQQGGNQSPSQGNTGADRATPQPGQAGVGGGQHPVPGTTNTDHGNAGASKPGHG